MFSKRKYKLRKGKEISFNSVASTKTSNKILLASTKKKPQTKLAQNEIVPSATFSIGF